MSNIVTARDIEMVTSDIKYAQQTGARQLLSNLIEIGRLLVEAKSMVPHGEWGKYLEEKVEYSQSTANNLMKLYQEYGDNQESFFGSFANSQAFGNLTYTQALALLALPAEERQEFAETHDVADMSTRQLEQAIRERNEERKAREAAEERADQQQAEAEAAKTDVEKLKEILARSKEGVNAANERMEKMQKQLDKAKANEKAAKEALEKAKENPEVPESVMERLRQEVAAEAAQKATEDLQKQLDAATKAKAVAEMSAQAAEQKLAAAQKQLQLASPEAAVFKTLFGQVQEDFNRLQGALLKVQQTDPDTGEKLRKALQTLLDKLRQDVSGG